MTIDKVTTKTVTPAGDRDINPKSHIIKQQKNDRLYTINTENTKRLNKNKTIVVYPLLFELS